MTDAKQVDRRALLSAVLPHKPKQGKTPARASRLYATLLHADEVKLKWHAAAHHTKHTRYDIYRDGKKLARTKSTTYTDKKVVADHAYKYAIRTIEGAHHSSLSNALKLRTPKQAAGSSGNGGAPGAGGGTTPTSGGTPTTTDPGPTPTPTVLTRAMVDRLYWRAGFGPTDAERDTWTGKPVADLIDFFLTSKQSLDSSIPAPLTGSNGAIDPTVSVNELTMEWLYTMQQASNPLIERLTFFLHRHWCVSRLSGEISLPLLVAYRDRLRRFADLPNNPNSSFRDLAYEMTTQDGAMSFFLNAYQNTKNGPNENYAREFMELFCLGVRDGAGNANYTQSDVSELARAFTGWSINQTPGADFGKITFKSGSFDKNNKTIFGHAANYGADPAQGSGASSAVDLVIGHSAHPAFLVRKLWAEFIVTPIPDDALSNLIDAYVAGGKYLLAPLVRGILSHPLMFESLDEPNMVKSPVVYLVGVQRPLKAPMKDFWQHEVLGDMQQCPYEAPNVAGWEGGLSWLNTNTAAARFDAILRTIHLKFNGNAYPGSANPADVPGETSDQAFDRAYALVGSPWLSDATKTQIKSFAASLPISSTNQTTAKTNRLQRLYALIAMILGGPDGQVM